MQSVLSDPEVVARIQEQLLRYQPTMEDLEAKLAAGDPVAKGCLREIACYLCDLCAHLGVDYDPAIGTLILQFVGGIMAQSPEKWVTYTREVAPGCNANKLRREQARKS